MIGTQTNSLRAPLAAVAARIEEASATRRPIAPVRSEVGTEIGDAYAIAAANIARKLEAGARITGRKIGLTARTVQKQLGVDQPDFGTLLDIWEVPSGGEIPASTLLQPRAEAEVVFILGRDLTAERLGIADVIRAVDCVLPAIEVVDSRIANWEISMVDTVADNASQGRYVLGAGPRKLRGLDLELCGMVLERNGEPLSFGAGAACLGNPIYATVWLAREMVRRGHPLRAGDLVLSGALGPMIAARPGDEFEARINGVGTVHVSFAKDSGAAHV